VLASYISNTTSFKIFVGGALRRIIMIYQDPSRLPFFFLLTVRQSNTKNLLRSKHSIILPVSIISV
jgi:hypothetical protein